MFGFAVRNKCQVYPVSLIKIWVGESHKFMHMLKKGALFGLLYEPGFVTSFRKRRGAHLTSCDICFKIIDYSGSEDPLLMLR